MCRYNIFALLLVFLWLPDLAAGDWEADLREELRQLGYSQAEIEEAVEHARTKRNRPSTEDFEWPSEQVERDDAGQPEASPLEEALHKHLTYFGITDKDLERQIHRLLRQTASQRRDALEKLAAEKWIEEKVEVVQKELESKGWSGSDLRTRLALEEKFFKEIRSFYKSEEVLEDEIANLEAVVTAVEPSLATEEKIATLRKTFEEELAKEYVEEVAHRLRRKWSEAIVNSLLEMRAEYLTEPVENRRTMIAAAAQKLEIEIFEKRQELLDNSAAIILQRIKLIWAETSLLDPKVRKAREKSIKLLCNDLVPSEDRATFERLLGGRLRDLKREGWHKDEIELIERELAQVRP